jgi:hypothetical protein
MKDRMTLRIGKIGSSAAAPTIKVKVAFSAPAVPPDTGASKNLAEVEAAPTALLTSSDVPVSMVELSKKLLKQKL